ncbi:MAG: DUF433 domain-containing protein [Magnetococcales bacterium]|nr:DUF433 domain-containing protein [Magnetococcales bacterium]
MVQYFERITVTPGQCGGRPCIRGMRIRVTDVLDLLANGLTAAQVLEENPDLVEEDVTACLNMASAIAKVIYREETQEIRLSEEIHLDVSTPYKASWKGFVEGFQDTADDLMRPGEERSLDIPRKAFE